MAKHHFYVNGDWVDCIDTDNAAAIAQRRQEVAERYGVKLEAVRVATADEVKYWK